MTQEEIKRRFNQHPPTDERARAHRLARTSVKWLAEMLNETLPEGREKATAFTKLEEVLMWSNAAIARQEAQ